MTSPKPRKFRRMMLTGHRVKVLRETKGHAVPDHSYKRYLHLDATARNRWDRVGWPGLRPARKPKAKK